MWYQFYALTTFSVCVRVCVLLFYSGCFCQEEGSEESRVQIESTEDCTSESGSYWESGSDDNSVYMYVPTPDRARLGKVSPVDLPNRLCFITLPDLGKFLKLLNDIRHCATPVCMGNLVPIGVKWVAAFQLVVVVTDVR